MMQTPSSSERSGLVKKGIVLLLVGVAVLSAVAYVNGGENGKNAKSTGVDRQMKAVLTAYHCPAGTYASTITANGCVCTKCPPGFQCPGGNNGPQVACTPGHYQPLSGQNECLKAGKGHYVPKSKATKQEKCPKGSYQDELAKTGCKLARKGRFAPNVAMPIDLLCPIGTFQPSVGQTACIDAPIGHYADKPGLADKKACKAGTYQDKTKQAGCKDAQKGSYVPADGASYQTACPHGSYTNQVRQTSCKPANPGHFVPSAGQSKQLACPAGHYQPCGGQHACIPCAAGTWSNGGATSCPFDRVCVVAKGVATSAFAKFRARKSGQLKSIKVEYQTGKFNYCSGNTVSQCWGYFGVGKPTEVHGFDLYFTRQVYTQVLFPLAGNTVGMSPKRASSFPSKFPFYTMAGKSAQSTQTVTYTNAKPQMVSQGEELRAYMGEVLYQYHPSDNSGVVCYKLTLTIV